MTLYGVYRYSKRIGGIDTDSKAIEISRLMNDPTTEIWNSCREIIWWKEARSHCMGSIRRDPRGTSNGFFL